MRRSFEVQADYLGETSSEPNLYEYGFQTTRIDRALKVYVSLAYYGEGRFLDIIDRNIQLAQDFAEQIRQSTDFQCALEPDLSIVVFRYVPQRYRDVLYMPVDSTPGQVDSALDALNARVERSLASTATILVSSTRLFGRFWLRFVQFLKACSEGVLHLRDEVIKWAEPPKIEEQQGNIQRYQGDLRDQECWKWPSFSQWCGGNRPQGLQSDPLVREVAASGWSTPHQAINALCEMNITFGSPYQQEIFLSIPVYVFIENMTVSTVDNSVRATYLRHSAIPGLNLLAFLKERDHNSIEVPLRRVPLTVEQTGSEEDIGIFSCWGEIETANRELLIELKAAHAVLGDVESVQDPLWRLIPEAERNVLLAALKRFCPQSRLQNILVKAYEHNPKRLKTSSAFELHIAWLLGLCGLSTIVLGEYEQLLAEQTGVQRASVDILASKTKNSVLLVGACTITTPKEEDFMNLAHACEILRREVFQDTSIRVFPVLFTGALGQSSYKQAGDEFTYVPIVDADRIGIVLELLEFGMERFFFEFLGNPLLCELRSPKDLS